MLLNFFLLFKFINNTTVPQYTTMEGSNNDDATKELLPEAKKMELEKIFLEIGEFIKNHLNMANEAFNHEKFSEFKEKINDKITKNLWYHELYYLGPTFCHKINFIINSYRKRINEFELKYKKIHSKKISFKEKCQEALNEIFKEDIGFELFQAWEMKMGDDFENKLDKKLENIKDTKVKEDLKNVLVNTYHYGYFYITYIKDFMETYQNIRSTLIKMK